VTKIALQPDDAVKPGDILELNFKLAGPLWLKATASAAIESRLSKKYPNFEIMNYGWTNDDTLFTVQVRVIEPKPAAEGEVVEAGLGAGLTVAIVSAALLGIAVIYWFTQDTTYKIVETATPAISLMAVAAIMFFAFKLFGKGGLST
jgi:hypothetical protein